MDAALARNNVSNLIGCARYPNSPARSFVNHLARGQGVNDVIAITIAVTCSPRGSILRWQSVREIDDCGPYGEHSRSWIKRIGSHAERVRNVGGCAKAVEHGRIG